MSVKQTQWALLFHADDCFFSFFLKKFTFKHTKWRQQLWQYWCSQHSWSALCIRLLRLLWFSGVVGFNICLIRFCWFGFDCCSCNSIPESISRWDLQALQPSKCLELDPVLWSWKASSKTRNTIITVRDLSEKIPLGFSDLNQRAVYEYISFSNISFWTVISVQCEPFVLETNNIFYRKIFILRSKDKEINFVKHVFTVFFLHSVNPWFNTFKGAGCNWM